MPTLRRSAHPKLSATEVDTISRICRQSLRGYALSEPETALLRRLYAKDPAKYIEAFNNAADEVRRTAKHG